MAPGNWAKFDKIAHLRYREDCALYAICCRWRQDGVDGGTMTNARAHPNTGAKNICGGSLVKEAFE